MVLRLEIITINYKSHLTIETVCSKTNYSGHLGWRTYLLFGILYFFHFFGRKCFQGVCMSHVLYQSRFSKDTQRLPGQNF